MIDRQIFFLILILCCFNRPLIAEDWLTYQHDNRQSAVTSEQLKFPLKQTWVRQSVTPPRPAWARPAKWDAYAEVKGLKAMRNYDHAFYTIAKGNTIWFGSSVDDAVHCINAASGKELWSFISDGPIRVVPTWSENKIYFGSDDGYAYCVHAETGKLIWKYKPGENDRLIPNNGKLISLYPCRTGVLVQNGKAYFGASLLPWKKSWLCAVDAQTGKVTGEGTFKQAVTKMTLEAPMLASATNLYVLQGRSFPALFQIANGKQKGVTGIGRQGGGVYGYLTENEDFLSGQGSLQGALVLHKSVKHKQMVTLKGANRIVVSGKTAWLHSGKNITALNHPLYFKLHRRQVAIQNRESKLKDQRKKFSKKKSLDQLKQIETEMAALQKETLQINESFKKCVFWQADCAESYSLVLAGNNLFAGGDDIVVAFDIATGNKTWSAPITGKGHGLTIANGHLFVSTSTGAIHCFATKK